jgi:tetratricopeptide (TPR) repeat protein
VEAVAWSPDGRWLVSGSRDRTLKVWDAVHWTEQVTLPGHTSWVSAVAWSPDGRWLVSGSQDRTLKVWDAVHWTEQATLSGHTGEVSAVAWNPDGRWLVSGSWDRMLKVWEAATGDSIAAFSTDAELVRCALAPNTGVMLRIAASDKAGQVHVLHLRGAPAADTPPAEAELCTLALTAPTLAARRRAAHRLGWIRPGTAPAPLTAALQAPNPVRRAAAAAALGWMLAHEAVAPLLVSLADAVDGVRVAAAGALLHLRARDAYEDALQTLVAVATASPDPSAQGAAAQLLQASPDPELVPQIVEALVQCAVGDGTPQSQEVAVHLLNELDGGLDALRQRIQALVEANDWEGVLRLTNRLLPLLPDDADLCWWRGQALLNQGEAAAALSDFTQVTIKEPQFAAGYLLQAEALATLGRRVEALEAARRAAELAPAEASWQGNLGGYAYQAGAYEEALAATERALELDPKLTFAAFNRALIQLAQGEPEAALAAYKSGLDLCTELTPDEAHQQITAARKHLTALAQAQPDLSTAVATCEQLLAAEVDGGGESDPV